MAELCPMFGWFLFTSLAVSAWANKHGNNTADLAFTSPKEMQRGILLRKIGQSVRLNCNAGGFPKPQIKWYKDSDQLIPFSRGEWTLTLFSLQVGHSGKYKCRVKNSAGMISHEYTLLVQEREKPRWLHIKPVVSVEGGQKATLSCEVSNWDWWRPPVVMWVKRYTEDQPPTRWQYEKIETAKEKKGIKTKFFYAALPRQPIRGLPDGRYGSDLVIDDVTERDAGVYYCYADDKWHKLRKRDAKLVVLPTTQAHQPVPAQILDSSSDPTSTLRGENSTLTNLVMYLAVSLASTLIVFFILCCLSYHIVLPRFKTRLKSSDKPSAGEMESSSANAVKRSESNAKNAGNRNAVDVLSLQRDTPDICKGPDHAKRVNPCEIEAEIVLSGGNNTTNSKQEKNTGVGSFKIGPSGEKMATKHPQKQRKKTIHASQGTMSRKQQARSKINEGASTSRSMQYDRKGSTSIELKPLRKSLINDPLYQNTINPNAGELSDREQGGLDAFSKPVFDDSGYVDMDGHRKQLGQSL